MKKGFMKKGLVFGAVAALALSMAACGSTETTGTSSSKAESAVTQSVSGASEESKV